MEWRGIPSLSALRAFEAAARCGSYSAAARELNVTHAAIAQHVRALEAELGTPLMERQGRGVVAVGAGRQLARDLAAGFAEIAAGIRAARAPREEGPISLTTTQSFAENWLMPRIASFWAAHPGVGVSITADNTVVDLRRSPHHLAIRYGRGGWPGLEEERLTEARSVIVGTPELVARLNGQGADTPEGRRTLTAMPWLADADDGEFFAWLRDQGAEPDALHVADLATNAMTLAACRAGAGLSVQPYAVVEGDLAAGRLVEVPARGETGLAYFVLVAPGPMPERVRLFLRWLRSVA
jgi:LysR family transcriptional regulator, glycine cleavage system transcriptional activator